MQQYNHPFQGMMTYYLKVDMASAKISQGPNAVLWKVKLVGFVQR